MNFKLHLLETLTNNFSEAHKIGSGGYGDVYKAVHEGIEIAVKRLRPLEGLNDKEFENEFRNVRKVHHVNVVKLLGYCHESKETFVQHDGKEFFATKKERIFCFEYMQGGTLDKHITADSCELDWPTCYKIIKGTCEGLNHLHTAYKPPIWHLDIKPANILLDKNKNAKIADLGLSRSATRTQETKNVKGSLGYMPPEYRNVGFITNKHDVYGLGVLIIQVLDGRNGLIRSIDKGAEPFLEHVYGNWNKRLKDRPVESLQVKKCVEIALRCVQLEREKRPTTKEVVDELRQLYDDTNVQGLDASNKLSSLKLPDQLQSSGSGPGPLDVVIVYAFDCSDWTSAWYTVDDGVFWMVQEKLTLCLGSRMGYIYPMVVNGNTYTSDMKLVDPQETKATGYTPFARRRIACTKNMASGLDEAHKMISNRGDKTNGVILLFSDGLINEGDFFDGAEKFKSQFPVHAFTLGGVECNQGLEAIAVNSPGGKFHSMPVPERPMLSQRFSLLLDSIFEKRTTFEDENPHSPSSENDPLDVVLVYAFDCTNSTLAWDKMDGRVFWMVQKKLTTMDNSCMGYIYPMLTQNTYTSDMKLVDSSDAEAGYSSFSRRRISCTRNMASGLIEAHKMIRNRGYGNGIILLFSDGLINKGDFFDGAENFRSEVPVHTFTLGGDAYNYGLQAVANNSPGGTFNRTPVPDRPDLSAPFSELLDGLLIRRNKAT